MWGAQNERQVIAMFGRRDMKDPTKLLRLRGDLWRQGDVLRVTPRRRFATDPAARRMVIRRQGIGECALTPMRWGLVPDWQRDDEAVRPLISVQAETIAGQLEWRRLLNARRCAVPTEQFFEWTRVDGVKAKEYAFRLKSRRPLMIAALWNRSPAQNGKTQECFAYVSCPANRLVGFVHDRMPVVLDEAGLAAWLNPDTGLEDLLALLEPCDSSVLDCSTAADASPRAKPYQPSLFARAA